MVLLVFLKSKWTLGKSRKQIHTKVQMTYQVSFPLTEGPRQLETPVSLEKEGTHVEEREMGTRAGLRSNTVYFIVRLKSRLFLGCTSVK